jgi:response regulator RpfG family c-di-GMP phosphodiesterase
MVFERSVLIADDEQLIRELIATTLSEDGYQCQTVSNGVEALSRLAEQPFAFLLSDIRMPQMGGLDLLDRVRELYPETSILLLTGAADVPMVVRALRSGVADFITKPFTIQDLRERMRTAVLARRAALAEREQERRRRERLESITERYRTLAQGVVESLSTALGAKHPETRAHSERVAALAATTASAMKMSHDFVQGIYVAGLLHDVGKVAVDATILDKPGLLDPAEFDQIRAHPRESERIVQPIAFSPVTTEAIRHHHERYDGKGYPDGLAADSIPLSARILAICDAYDAMTSERAYSPALSMEDGLFRLKQGAGMQWDPTIVEIFTQMESNPIDVRTVVEELGSPTRMAVAI